MQKGSLIRSSRRQGPDVWEYRWREFCSGQTRKHRREQFGQTGEAGRSFGNQACLSG